MAKSIHIVVGCTGMYEDASQWNVLAYTDEKAAKAHVSRANRWAKSNDLLWNNNGGISANHSKKQNPSDPNMRVDSMTGVKYVLESVSLAD